MNKIYLLQLAVLGCALSAQAQTSQRRSALPKAECHIAIARSHHALHLVAIHPIFVIHDVILWIEGEVVITTGQN